MPRSSRTFATDVDWWLGALVMMAPLACAASILAALSTDSAPGLWIGVGSTLMLAVLGWAVVWPIHYTVGASHLGVKAGHFIRREIPLDAITKVTPSKNPVSSPAFSMNRLKVDYEGGWVLISPKQREVFLETLAAATGLTKTGEELS